MALSSGARLGPYEIVGPIGAGGMGEVYRATDTHLGRDVAIKVLPEAFAQDAERLARFEREARTLAALNHPNISAVYGLEKSSGVHALVMELVEGPTLADRIAHGAIPLDDAIPIATQIAEALEAAHEQGIIHRDLKPANIKVRDDGTVKVLDFGLAKIIHGDGAAETSRVGDTLGASQSPTITTPAMTQLGVILGTAAYMSPEQAKGREADKRSDLWAFGCVLYEMLTGRRAFEGEDVGDTLAAVIRGEPDWNALPSSTPAAIRLLIRRCLEKSGKRRVGDIAAALFVVNEQELTGSTASTSSIPAQRRSHWLRVVPALLVTIISAIVTSLVWWDLRPLSLPTAVTRFALTLPEGERFEPSLQSVAISPDGTQMVYAAGGRLHVHSLSQGTTAAIAGTENPGMATGSPMFSPDGKSIAFFAGSQGGGSLKRVALSGGSAITIASMATTWLGGTWGPQGILFGQYGVGIMRVTPGGGGPEALVQLSGDYIAQGPSMLPDGDNVLFTLARYLAPAFGLSSDMWSGAAIVAQSLKSGERKTLIQGGSDVRYLPSGHLVYVLRGIVFAVPFDAKRLQVIGDPLPVIEGVSKTGLAAQDSGAAHLSVSDTGTLVYVPGPVSTAAIQSMLVSIDRAGHTEPLKLPSGTYIRPRVSPNALQIAYGSDDGRSANVWTYDLSGTSHARQLTFDGKSRSPIWSADGRYIAFQSDQEGNTGIFWQRSDGSTKAERLTTSDKGTLHTPDAWSPDGKRFLFTATRGGENTLWTFSLDERKATRFGDITSSRLLTPVFSPDGKWVAYTEPSEGQNRTYAQPFPSTGAKYLIGEGGRPQWSPDGKEIFFLSGAGTMVASFTAQPEFRVGNPTLLPVDVYRGLGPSFGRNADILPDGQRFIAAVPTAEFATAVTSTGARDIRIVLNWTEELKRLVPTH